MRINELWKQMRKELEEKYDGITLGEYGNTTSGSKVIRGPHVTLMIPAKKEITCKCCETKLEADIPKPTRKDIEGLMGIVNKYLCPVTWDGNSKHEHFAGNIKNGWYYEIIFDKVEIGL